MPAAPTAPPDPFYPLLGLSPDAAAFTVLRAAARAFHPTIRKDSGLRLARRRFYRQMLAAHAAAVSTFPGT
ncbi:hypothetical protein H0485_20775 [Pseudogemmobacter sp. CC-YST710]|uniref:J domain-containing protein n=1 Tax=Pseudogemmobacter faecipullorum TaxID=2755041 RepID=A0ABS8CSM5_9RHOB|nr:hypothetical protein [Pseudogemmobacter faecipullorum]MCB5412405.1 hypothetical protein [Pseudogemmobacter faecipullorum]